MQGKINMTTEKYAVTFKFVKTGTVYTRVDKDKTPETSREIV